MKSTASLSFLSLAGFPKNFRRKQLQQLIQFHFAIHITHGSSVLNRCSPRRLVHLSHLDGKSAVFIPLSHSNYYMFQNELHIHRVPDLHSPAGALCFVDTATAPSIRTLVSKDKTLTVLKRETRAVRLEPWSVNGKWSLHSTHIHQCLQLLLK